MAKVIVIRNTYGGVEYIKNMLKYVHDGRAKYVGAFGVDPYNPAKACINMIITRKKYSKVSGNPLVHIVISYNKSVKEIETAALFGKECAKYFSSEYQLMYCTHDSDSEGSYFHTHIIINSVSYIDGHMIVTGYDEMKKFCDYVSEVTGQYTQFYFKNKAENK